VSGRRRFEDQIETFPFFLSRGWLGKILSAP
jgi:hypothetical protein